MNPPADTKLPFRFWSRVRQSEGCWLWTGALNVRNNYGYINMKTDKGWKPHLVHKLAYEDQVGAAPPGKELQHTCLARECVAPQHLKAVTRGESNHIHARRLVCKRGHLVVGQNVCRRPDGSRTCRTCKYATNDRAVAKEQGDPKRKEKKRLYRAAYRRANKERSRVTEEAWRLAHPEERQAALQRYRARKASLPATLTPSEWRAIKAAYNYKCAYCGKKAKLTQDHVIPLSKGGGTTRENIVPACKLCNCRKFNGPPLVAVRLVLL